MVVFKKISFLKANIFLDCRVLHCNKFSKFWLSSIAGFTPTPLASLQLPVTISRTFSNGPETIAYCTCMQVYVTRTQHQFACVLRKSLISISRFFSFSLKRCVLSFWLSFLFAAELKTFRITSPSSVARTTEEGELIRMDRRPVWMMQNFSSNGLWRHCGCPLTPVHWQSSVLHAEENSAKTHNNFTARLT